ncbi:AAA family ATPase [Romboutsia maritimum]|uniref:AAA family ATPase n=1 Tax=Romboutsia maritimum TaxID=2020948 RepID=A0A371IVW8_9FIRM|nr:AAA family ATPase [Romboutsia maritimum]RDY24621.1 AAA family ATPase [Romboutsia maritimum]
MNTKDFELKEKFSLIEKVLNKNLIGQSEFISSLCGYFEDKFSKGEKGNLFLIGEKDTSKKTSVRLVFENLEKNNLIESGKIDEINLGSYNFNLGYNAFLTDLYYSLGSSSECLLFKNIEEANDEILKILSEISPNKHLDLDKNYIIKNKFLLESDDKNKNSIDNLICKNKFYVFTSNDKNINKNEVFSIYNENKLDKILHTKNLNIEERNLVVKKSVLEVIEKIKQELNIDIVLDINQNEGENQYSGICEFLQTSYKEDSSFGIYEYVSYKLDKPIRNLVRVEGVQFKNKIIIYVENDEIYCKTDKGLFGLSNYSTPTLEEAKYKLNSIIGMKDLKNFISNVKNNYKVQKIRERLGLKTSNISMNMIFAGNAGTGKTNAARITFEYLNALGVLSTGAYREVSKADFVSENANDTAKKTNDIINSALGGVLFIDEAYSLCESDDDKLGKEIVDALLKGVEDNRDNLVVILAGYENDMNNFLSFNPGLKSRFPNIIRFEDYNPEEMYEIAVNIAKSKGYRIANNVKKDLIDLFAKNQIIGKNDLGNARFVRNIVENAIMDASKKYLTNSDKQIDLLERDNFNFKVKAKFDLEEKLSEIIGLEEVKKLLRNQYKLIVAQEKRKAVGIETKIDQNLNMVFTGNPGTGKTSVARLVGEMLNSMGLLKVGQLIETDRSSFVSDIKGETAKKTEIKFKEAIGGILFIDEAYTLANDSLGREAVETLLKLIEDYSKEVIVILAGYENEMEDFFDVNIGLRSRFPLWTNFEDYNPNELLEMAIKLIESKGFGLSKNANSSLKKNFIDIYEKSDSQSGNGRMVRNYVENLIRNQSIRIAENDISVYEMNLINTTDVESINVYEYGNEFNLENKLNKLVGNEKNKNFLRNQYKLIKTKEKREKIGIRSDINKYMNMVFTGEIGTGKKTILNILSEMYYSMGIVKAKSMVELDTMELITLLNNGIKLEDILNKSIGKILLIDKVHLLLNDINCKETIASLIKFIDNNKNRIVIVLSGSISKVKELVLSNPSLNYRFPIWLDFEDYTREELFNIAVNLILKKGFLLDNGAERILKDTINEFYENENLSLKNGLMIKDYLDKLIRTQSTRAYDKKIHVKEVNIINSEDIMFSKREFLLKNTFVKEDKTLNIKNINSNIEYNFNIVDELFKLKNLLDLNLINKEEFEILKNRLIK